MKKERIWEKNKEINSKQRKKERKKDESRLQDMKPGGRVAHYTAPFIECSILWLIMITRA